MALACADLGDGRGFFWDVAEYPTVVSHHEIDTSEVSTGACDSGCIVREVVEEFRGELAHSWGNQ